VTPLESNIIAALAQLRAARTQNNNTTEQHYEARLNWLIERMPQHSDV
jgi:hypothetical protein